MPIADHRRLVAVSLGCHATDAVCPHVDPGDVPTAVAGGQKRFTAKPPTPNRKMRRSLRRFVKKWCKKNLVPLSPESDTSVRTWLASTSYTQARKDELLRKWEAMSDIEDPTKKYLACQSFIKDETYPSYKHSRCINSRSDEFKVTVGPIFRLIEKVVFQHEAFIKKIPIAERPAYIRNLLHVEGADYFAADYTSFEALFTKELMEDCEFIMYKYMTQYLPEGKQWMSLVKRVMGGINECIFKDFTIEVLCTRMSGEMNTSLGNGFTNLMVLLFLAEWNGCDNIKVVVEGDDSMARMTGPRPTAEQFEMLGMRCKVEFHEAMETASFCGLVFDVDDLVNVTDPREVLATFGWSNALYAKSSSRKLKMLLRCKALSMAHQYPGCPIISALAQYGLRMTRSYDVRHFIAESGRFSVWERDQLVSALKDEKKIRVREPPMKTRLLVDKLYGLTIDQQLKIEQYFNSCQVLRPFSMRDMVFNIPSDWEDYCWKYVRLVDIRTKESEFPAGFQPLVPEFVSNENKVVITRAMCTDSMIRR